jgi:hypothetical protein
MDFKNKQYVFVQNVNAPNVPQARQTLEEAVKNLMKRNS